MKIFVSNDISEKGVALLREHFDVDVMPNMKPEELDMLFPHQANYRIITSAAKRLKMPMDKVWVNVDKYANTSAASIPIALCEAQKAGALKKGDNIILDGFGAGLTWAAIVLKWSK
mgnify:CR=1 FL=1